MPYTEGQTVTSKSGESYVFKNGGWWPMPASPLPSNPMLPAPPAAAAPTEPDAEEPTVGVGEDTKRSIIPSLVRGTVALGSTPASMRDLAAKGTNWALDKLGIGEKPEGQDVGSKMRGELTIPGTDIKVPMAPIGPLGGMPYEDVMKLIEHVGGQDLYKAQTPTGKMASAVMEAVPNMAAGPGTAMKKVVQGVAGALGSEGLGQALEGTPYEAPGRIMGALFGSGVPSAIRRTATPFPATPERTAQAKLLKDQGVNVTAGQATDSPVLKRVEGALVDSVGAPKSVRPEGQQAQVTKKLMEATGSADDTAVGNNVMKQGTKLSQGFEDVANRNDMMFDKQMVDDLRDARNKYFRTTRGHATELNDRINQITAPVGPSGSLPMGLTGQQYQHLRSDIGAQARQIEKQNPTLAASLRGVRDTLDATMSRSLKGKPDEGRFEQLREQWANYKAMQKAADKRGAAASGIVDPADVFQAHKVKTSPGAQFARAAESVVQPLPQHDSHNMHVLQAIGSMIGAGGAGYGLGAIHGLEGSVAGYLSFPAMVNALLKSPPLAGTVFNPKVQKYLANQKFRPGPNTAFDPQIAARILAGSPALRGPAAEE